MSRHRRTLELHERTEHRLIRAGGSRSFTCGRLAQKPKDNVEADDNDGGNGDPDPYYLVSDRQNEALGIEIIGRPEARAHLLHEIGRSLKVSENSYTVAVWISYEFLETTHRSGDFGSGAGAEKKRLAINRAERVVQWSSPSKTLQSVAHERYSIGLPDITSREVLREIMIECWRRNWNPHLDVQPRSMVSQSYPIEMDRPEKTSR